MSKNNGNHKKPDARKISKKLTLKQRRFVSVFTNPEGEGFGNQTRAAELAGYSQLAPAQAGHRLMRNGEIKGEVERIASSELNHILDAAGVTIERLAKRVRQGLDAKEIKAFIHQKTGRVVYAKRRPDYNIQLKAVRLAAELRGDFAPKEMNIKVAVLAGRLDAAKRRERERAPQAEEKTEEVQPSE